jgi:hypothetical protein
VVSESWNNDLDARDRVRVLFFNMPCS